MTNRYATALEQYLADNPVTQEALASRINITQAAISRYANGRRVPDSETARLIDDATAGAVPFSLWQSVIIDRLGIGEAA
jgi:transcriptional regulator with XRE-family HTH domain